MITSRERLQTSLGHRTPDRIPVDFERLKTLVA
jgi:hypothetical protein